MPTIGVAPTPLTDPALWPYLAEPELFLLVVGLGIRYTWMQLGLCWAMAKLRVRRVLASIGSSYASTAAALARSRFVIVSHEHKFVFVHIHKTAGESITEALEPYLGPDDIVLKNDFDTWARAKTTGRYADLGRLGKHTKARVARASLGAELWDSYFTFSFVREPIDRAMSLYRYVGDIAERRQERRLRHLWYRTNGGRDADPARWPATQAYLETDSFSAFVRHPGSRQAPGLRPQVASLCSKDKARLLVDEVGRYENLAADFAAICARIGLPDLGLPERNVSPPAPPAVDEDARRLLVERYALDYDRFGYPRPPLT